MSGQKPRTNQRSSRPQFRLRWRVARCCCALVFAATVVHSSAAQSWLPISQAGALPSREPAGHLISKTAHPSVGRIVVQEKDGVAYGTGSLIDVRGEHGLMVTNWHVVRDALPNSIYVFFADGFQTPATIVKVDRDWDLAALSIRKPPTAAPIVVAQQAPRAGEWLCIAGYGSGDYRAAAGRCTQYVSPGQHLPYEMVEVAAEARQGDSGGPIFNERGELAGVLFGSARGTTSGSYAGRVQTFLQGVVPVDVPAGTIPHAASLAQQTPGQPPMQLPTQSAPAADAHLFSTAGPLLPSQETAAADAPANINDQRAPAPTAVAYGPQPELAPVEVPPRPLMPLPERSAAPLTLVTGEEPLGEDRTALRPTTPGRDDLDERGLGGRELALSARDRGPLAADALSALHTPLPPRLPSASPLETTPADQLIAAAWKQVGGSTLFDQGKTLLAVLGLLGLLIQFWRLNNRPDPATDYD